MSAPGAPPGDPPLPLYTQQRNASPNAKPVSRHVETGPHTASSGSTPATTSSSLPKLAVERDIRTRLPTFLRRFAGYRPLGSSPPFAPLPFPPFSWLRHIPLQYEVWLLSLIATFIGILLIEATMAGTHGMAPQDTMLIVASFGASAVLSYGAIDSPLAQPRHLVGGQVVCAITGVVVTRLFRLTSRSHFEAGWVNGEIPKIVWINGALAMALSSLAMQVTGTVHPPGGATALIAATTPGAITMSWRYIYIVLVSSLLMLGWALIINNVGRRRYPAYWLHGTKVFVQPSTATGGADLQRLRTEEDVQMAAVEGRIGGFAAMERALSHPSVEDPALSPPPQQQGPGQVSPAYYTPRSTQSLRRNASPRGSAVEAAQGMLREDSRWSAKGNGEAGAGAVEMMGTTPPASGTPRASSPRQGTPRASGPRAVEPAP